MVTGELAPDFTLSTYDGKQVSLSGYANPVVVLECSVRGLTTPSVAPALEGNVHWYPPGK